MTEANSLREVDNMTEAKVSFDSKNFAIRVGIYLIGLLFGSFGVAFAINGGLGISPINSLPFIVSNILGVYMGVVVTSLLVFYLFLQVLILGKAFKPIQVTQILASFVFGYFVDFSRFVVGDFTLPTYVGQLAMTGISILLIGTGITLFMSAKLVNLPGEGLVAAIAQRFNLPVHQAMIGTHSTVVAIGVILSFSFLGELIGVREGTVLSAIFIGKTVQHVKKLVQPLFVRLGLSETN